ncbi:hypothetical protein BASA81_000468 [Batrachochytrium salamandrivorans]|nr:hypothetical protein BASA81_000468 [Batrachochytrium salamandrivorans]
MTQPEGFNENPYASADPHADPSKIPRTSNPLSFLSKSAFLLAILGMLAATTSVEAANDCVCNYDPTVDYFPNKIQPDYSSNFRIEYFKSYKKMTVIDSKVEYVTYAYLCGTPVPNLGNANNTIEIPIKSAAVVSSTFVPYIEYIGERESLFFVSADHTQFKSCLRNLYDQGRVVNGTFNKAGILLTNSTAYKFTGAPLDVVFMDSYNYKNALRTTVTNTLGPRTKSIYIAEQLEFHPLGKLEWVEFVAALYNKEYLVMNLAADLNAKYDCVKDLVVASPPAVKKKVLWGYCYYSTYSSTTDCYVGACPNYYCDLVKDAGGVMVSNTTSRLNTTQMYDLAAQADVWIFTSDNFGQQGASPQFYTGDVKTLYDTLPVVINKQVYDYLGQNPIDWFDDAKAQPGVVLMDLTQVLYGDRYVSTTARKPDFLRNVFTEPAASSAPRLGADCNDTAAPLYTLWDAGFCAMPSAVELTTKPDIKLCTSDAATTMVHTMCLIIGVMFAGMWL